MSTEAITPWVPNWQPGKTLLTISGPGYRNIYHPPLDKARPQRPMTLLGTHEINPIKPSDAPDCNFWRHLRWFYNCIPASLVCRHFSNRRRRSDHCKLFRLYNQRLSGRNGTNYFHKICVLQRMAIQADHSRLLCLLAPGCRGKPIAAKSAMSGGSQE